MLCCRLEVSTYDGWGRQQSCAWTVCIQLLTDRNIHTLPVWFDKKYRKLKKIVDYRPVKSLAFISILLIYVCDIRYF